MKIFRSKYLAIFLIILGFFLILASPIYKQTLLGINKKSDSSRLVRVSSSEPIHPDVKLKKEDYKNEEIPVRIIIPDLKTDLLVTPSEIIGGYWEVSETNASFGLGSGAIGKPGNAVIFAHARDGLFGNLNEIKKGHRIYVFSKDKYFTYEVISTKEVLPNDIEVISPTSDPVLTLYTCSGFADSHRLIVKSKLLNPTDSI